MPGTLNLAAAAEALKKWYLPGLQYQLNNSSPIMSVLERDSESVAGEKIVMALRYGRQGGIGNRADDGDMPTPNSRKTKQAIWDTKNIFAQIQISDKTMRSSRSSRGAFVALLEADLEDALVDAKDNMSRQVFGNGLGIMATTAANAATVTLIVNSVQYLAEGMIIDICSSTGVVEVSGREILVVDDIALTIKISGAVVTTDATDIIVISGNYGLELTGLGSVFNTDSTLYGVVRATDKWFNPTVISVAGEISEVKLQQGEDDVDRKAGGKTNFYAASYGVRRAYQNLQLANKQIVDVMELVGGWKTLSYNGKPFTADKYAPAQTLYGLDLSTWRFYQLMDFDWLDEDGAVLSRVSNKAVWGATLARYCDIGCSKPKGNFKMTGITEH